MSHQGPACEMPTVWLYPAAKVELQVSLAKCSGKLETCQKDFNRVMR